MSDRAHEGKQEGAPIFVGVDDGYAETKVCLGDGRNVRIPSQLKAGKLNQISINASALTAYEYQTDEGNFIIGDIRETDPTEFDGYPVSAMNRVAVAHAIRKAGVSGCALMVCSGLPIKKFYRSGKINKELVNAKRKNLLRDDVVALDGTELAQIVNHDVISEGIAAWMDLVLRRNTHGKLEFDRALVSERVAIIDIGGRTTDIAVVKDCNLDESRSSTIYSGMLAVREAIAQAIADRYEISPTSELINSVMKTGHIKLWGKPVNITELIEQEKRTVVRRIESETKKRLGDGSDLDKVVFVGGTVNEIQAHLGCWYPQQIIGSEPGFANARGMQKFAEMMMGQ